MTSLATLVLAFARVGLGAFGGGVGAIPLIQYELVTRSGWLSPQGFDQVLALSQVTPGPIAVNAATFVGLAQDGLAGALLATGAVVGTPLAALEVLRRLLLRASPKGAERFRQALGPAVAGLFLLALLPLLRASLTDLAHGLLLGACLGATRLPVFRKHPPLLVVAAGLAGLALFHLLPPLLGSSLRFLSVKIS